MALEYITAVGYVTCTTTVLWAGDHSSRRWYDNLWSVLRPGQIGPLHNYVTWC